MSVTTYPIFFMPIGNDSIVGRVIGEDYECIGANKNEVSAKLKKMMIQDLKKDQLNLFQDLSECELRTIYIKTQTTTYTENKKYTSKQVVRFPVAAVVGVSEYGDYDCYLPYFDISFYFDHLDDLHDLVVYHGIEELKELSPSELYGKLAMIREPSLGFVDIAHKSSKSKTNHDAVQYTEECRELSRYARQISKSSLRDGQAFSGITWERESLIDRLSDKIINETGNFILIGASGAGKSNLLGSSIKRSLSKIKAKDKSKRRSYWRCSSHRFLSGSKYLGDWQENCEQIVDRLEKVNGLLWVDDFTEMLFKGGGNPESSVAAFFEPFLAQQQLRMIGEATLEQWQKAKREFSRFCEHFEVIEVPELEEEDMKRLLLQLQSYSKESRRIEIEASALECGAQLLEQYVKSESNPGKTVRFFKHCLSEAHALDQKVLKSGDLIHLFCKHFGVNELFVNDKLKLDEEKILQEFNAEIIGQSHIFSELIETMRVFKLSLNDPSKPISTMIFSGPTGVGKTAMVKLLTKIFFEKKGNALPLIRLDMSEYQHPQQIEKLIGSRRQPGYLIKEARRNPFHILLLDEIEKAHSQFFDILLSILDEGRLVDHTGKQAHFKNALIIMTTNLGANQSDPVGFGQAAVSDPREMIAKYFRPEFINRIDTTLVFNALSEEDARKITDIELNKIKDREGIKKRKLELCFDPSLKEAMSKLGFSSRYGARFLQRSIEEKIVGPLSREILTKDLKERLLTLSWVEGKLKI